VTVAQENCDKNSVVRYVTTAIRTSVYIPNMDWVLQGLLLNVMFLDKVQIHKTPLCSRVNHCHHSGGLVLPT
jgi:hypothetical protein